MKAVTALIGKALIMRCSILARVDMTGAEPGVRRPWMGLLANENLDTDFYMTTWATC